MPISSRAVAPLLIAALLCGSVHAVEMRGQVAFTYEGSLFSKSPSDDDKAQALHLAKIAALKEYFATLGPAEQKLLKAMMPQIEANPDAFLTNTVIVAEDVDKGLKTFSLVVRAGINEQMISAELKSKGFGTEASGEGSAISALFVARQVTELKQFDERRTSITKAEASVSGSYANGTEKAASMRKEQSGGNVVRKASKSTYGLLSATDFDAAFNSILTSHGYEAIDYADVASECAGPRYKLIQDAFMTGDELPQTLRKQAIAAAKKCDVKYFAAGYMNVNAPEYDSVSGNRKVMVSVNGMVWDISKKLPRKVGSVGPVQAFGLGPDDEAARRAALEIAAQKAADIMTNQLKLKNIR